MAAPDLTPEMIPVVAVVTLMTADGPVAPGGVAEVTAAEAPSLIARGFAEPAPDLIEAASAAIAEKAEAEAKAEAERVAAAAKAEAEKAAAEAAAKPKKGEGKADG